MATANGEFPLGTPASGPANADEVVREDRARAAAACASVLAGGRSMSAAGLAGSLTIFRDILVECLDAACAFDAAHEPGRAPASDAGTNVRARLAAAAAGVRDAVGRGGAARAVVSVAMTMTARRLVDRCCFADGRFAGVTELDAVLGIHHFALALACTPVGGEGAAWDGACAIDSEGCSVRLLGRGGRDAAGRSNPLPPVPTVLAGELLPFHRRSVPKLVVVGEGGEPADILLCEAMFSAHGALSLDEIIHRAPPLARQQYGLHSLARTLRARRDQWGALFKQATGMPL